MVPEDPELNPVPTLLSKTSQQRRAKRHHQPQKSRPSTEKPGRARGGGRPKEGEEALITVWPASALSWTANRKGSRPGSGMSRAVLWQSAQLCGGGGRQEGTTAARLVRGTEWQRSH